jgi:hypothetical protein
MRYVAYYVVKVCVVRSVMPLYSLNDLLHQCNFSMSMSCHVIVKQNKKIERGINEAGRHISHCKLTVISLLSILANENL